MTGAALAPLLVGGLLELAKLGLQVYLTAMRMQGKTPEEIEEMYQASKAEFLANPPDTLSPVPE